MYNSGDAAEQVVRMSLEGAEVALKITGAAAKNLAAALYTVLKDQKKTKGKARIETMLREKRPLKVYTIKKEDCPEFARQAKGYGILYAPIPVRKEDDTIDILVFQDDAARANRIVEKFKLTVVDTASIKEDIEKSREERGGEPAAPEKAAPEKSEDDTMENGTDTIKELDSTADLDRVQEIYSEVLTFAADQAVLVPFTSAHQYAAFNSDKIESFSFGSDQLFIEIANVKAK